MPELNKMHVLLVEDDEVDAMVVKRAFAKIKSGCTIAEAKDGIEALELLRSRSIPEPTIILLDINMPRMSGFEFLKELREDADLAGHVVFILSTSNADEDMALAYEFNVAGYIVKEQVCDDYSCLTKMLTQYWNTAALPEKK